MTVILPWGGFGSIISWMFALNGMTLFGAILYSFCRILLLSQLREEKWRQLGQQITRTSSESDPLGSHSGSDRNCSSITENPGNIL